MSEVVLAIILAFFALLGGLGAGAFLFRRKEKEPTKTFEEDVQKILENAQREAERIINLAKEEAQRVRQEAEERKREVEGLLSQKRAELEKKELILHSFILSCSTLGIKRSLPSLRISSKRGDISGSPSKGQKAKIVLADLKGSKPFMFSIIAFESC